MEAHFETSAAAPLVIGGLPDADARTVRGAIRIPYGLSLLAEHDPHAVVTGLDAFPRELWPNVTIVHLAFQVMVACGFALIGVATWYWISRWRSGPRPSTWLLRALLVASPLGFVALEAGWLVTEVGRQPWVIYEIMRTADGVTPVADVPLTLLGFSVLYVALGAALVYLLLRLADHGR
jgi:cytochrome d ubiquinol oxidase subunit I